MLGWLPAVYMLAALPAQAGEELHIERARQLPSGPCATDLDVALYLTVVDSQGRPVHDLTRNDFQLIVNAQLAGPDSRPPVLVKDVETAIFEPVSVALVSELTDAPAVKALKEIYHGLPRVLSLYDAPDLNGTLHRLRTAGPSERKLLVYLGDGSGAEAFEPIANDAVRDGIVIDTVGWGKPEKLGALERLAHRTGGVARICRDASDLSRQLDNVRDEIRQQYVMHVTFPLFGSSARSVQVILQGHSYSNTITIDRALPKARPEKPRSYYFLYSAGFLAFITLMLLLYQIFRRRR